MAPRDYLDQMRGRVEVFREYLSTEIGEPVAVELEVIPVEYFHFAARPPTESGNRR